jgi:hypothetical protein
MTDAQARALILDFRQYGWSDEELVAMFDANRDKQAARYPADGENALARYRVAANAADAIRWAAHVLHSEAN